MKKVVLIFFTIIFCAFFLCSCEQDSKFVGTAFSTDYINNYYNDKNAKSANDKIINAYSDYESLLSPRIEGSDVYRINHSEEGTAVSVSDVTLYLLKESHDAFILTSGAFNPLMYSITCLWGFDDSEKEKTIPTKAQITEILPYCSFDYLDIDYAKKTVTRKNKNTKLDFGGIAKGYVMDEARKLAEQSNIDACAINLGNSILSMNKELVIGVKPPRRCEYSYLISFKLSNMSVATSGDYQRFFEHDGKRYCHIIGKDGYPIDNGIQSVSIIANNAIVADIFSTAVFVMGVDCISILSEKYPDSAVVIISQSENAVYCSDKVKERLQFKPVSSAYEITYHNV